MRAPARPFSPNSEAATSRMLAFVRSGSLVRVASLAGGLALAFASRVARGFACTNWFIGQSIGGTAGVSGATAGLHVPQGRDAMHVANCPSAGRNPNAQ